MQKVFRKHGEINFYNNCMKQTPQQITGTRRNVSHASMANISSAFSPARLMSHAMSIQPVLILPIFHLYQALATSSFSIDCVGIARILPRIEKTYKHINQNENKFRLVEYTAEFY